MVAQTPQQIIATKRDGGSLTEAQIEAFVDGLTTGSWGDGQVGAMAMAILLNGMEKNERLALTLEMARSGDQLSWDDLDLDGPLLDKHSTGGVGDKVSLILAPIMACLGAYMPKMSGPGLGHTGGTVDKMESIPGYNCRPSNHLFRQTVQETGFAIIGQSGDLAPADKRLYALRDVTATVPSVDLISASILSKKLATAPQGLVLDVKVGSGAFMATIQEAENLARAMVEIGQGAGVKTGAVLTNMDQVLGCSVGNRLEVQEAINFLKGEHQDPRLAEIVFALVKELAKASAINNPIERVNQALSSGAAATRFERMVHMLGGPSNVCANPLKPTGTLVEAELLAPKDGTLARMDAAAFGHAVVALGGGRTKPAAPIDHDVGIETTGLHVGQSVTKGMPLARVFARSDDAAAKALERLSKALTWQDAAVDVPATVLKSL